MNKQPNYIFLFLFCTLINFGYANTNPEDGIKTLEAVRTESRPIIDGKIDKLFEKSTFKATDFTTFEPIPGLPTEFKTEVSVIYDNQAVFIAAKMYDEDIQSMIKDLSPRDRINNSDYFGVTFDPYQTGISGFTFRVSAAGVQVDVKETLDDSDNSWNEVWRSEVNIYDDHWVVEMAIPYSALRFPTGEVNDWNIQFERSVRKTRELSFWNPVDPAKNGFLTQMGTLKNIQDIDAPLRLSVTPYVGIQLNSTDKGNGEIGVSPKFAGGLDLKYGINEAFTLDMILIPDFSQVRSDVQILNLGPFEVRFDENRPFFTEGLELFNTAGVFYTRRIGGNGFLRNELFQDPNVSSINSLPTNNLINATKISGRTNTNTGIGFFNAVEAPTYAEYTDTLGESREKLINPLTNYNVVVVEQALKNNSKVAFINTNVLRNGYATDANVTGLEWNLRNKSERYALTGKYVNSQKFFENTTSLGYAYNLNFQKIAGAWNYELGTSVESANYDINDLGFLFSPNEQNYFGGLAYNQYKPKNDKIANWSLSGGMGYNQLFDPNVFTGFAMNFRGFMRLKTFDAFGFYVYGSPFGFRDYFEPRTSDFSLFLEQERNLGLGGFISTDYRKPVALDVNWDFENFDYEDRYYGRVSIAPRFRLNAKIFLVPNVSFEKSSLDRGYVFYNSDLTPDLNPLSDIMIGQRDLNSVTNSLTGQFNITDKMSLTLEVNHYFSSVKYRDFNTLEADGKLVPYEYNDAFDENGVSIHDTNYNFFTTNIVYTWRFAPGSDLIISYKSNLTKLSDSQSYFDNVAILGDFYKSSGLNLKALYFLDINRFRKS